VKTTAGPVNLKRPKVRGTLEAFSSRLLGKAVTLTNALEALVISGWVRGLSTRDIEAALSETLGPDAAVSRSTVSQICRAIGDQFDAFKRRDLSQVDLAYLYVDASHFRYHHAAAAEPVLVAYRITLDGDAVLLAVDGANAESHDACAAFLRGLVARGPGAPLLTISDGGAGLVGALDRVFDTSARQRCLVHRSWNARAKVSKADATEVKADFWAIFDDVNAVPGDDALAQARRHVEELVSKWGARYPGAVACVTDDLDPLLAHLRFPRAHWRRIRHSNLIERTFGETRRRVKVMGRLPGKRSCLSLVRAVLDRATGGWRGVTVTPADARLLAGLRASLAPDAAPGAPDAPSGAAGETVPAAGEPAATMPHHRSTAADDTQSAALPDRGDDEDTAAERFRRLTHPARQPWLRPSQAWPWLPGERPHRRTPRRAGRRHRPTRRAARPPGRPSRAGAHGRRVVGAHRRGAGRQRPGSPASATATSSSTAPAARGRTAASPCDSAPRAAPPPRLSHRWATVTIKSLRRRFWTRRWTPHRNPHVNQHDPVVVDELHAGDPRRTAEAAQRSPAPTRWIQANPRGHEDHADLLLHHLAGLGLLKLSLVDRHLKCPYRSTQWLGRFTGCN
jgi:transposase-like protein